MDIKAPPSPTLPAVRPSPADLAKRINEKYSEIVASLRTTFIRAVEIGELLEQAKDRVGHGNFEVWLNRITTGELLRYVKTFRGLEYATDGSIASFLYDDMHFIPKLAPEGHKLGGSNGGP